MYTVLNMNLNIYVYIYDFEVSPNYTQKQLTIQ